MRFPAPLLARSVVSAGALGPRYVGLPGSLASPDVGTGGCLCPVLSPVGVQQELTWQDGVMSAQKQAEVEVPLEHI